MVHDDYSDLYRQVLPRSQRLSLQYASAQLAYRLKLSAARRAQAVIHSSDFGRLQLRDKVRAERSTRQQVVYWGLDPALQTEQDPGRVRVELAEELELRRPFLLYVGAISRLKNVEGLVGAYLACRELLGDLDLVVVGNDSWPSYGVSPLKGVEGARQLSGMSDATVAKLYRVCEAFVTLSWGEGFGLPVAEAMSYGRPVVVSDRGSLPEIVGDSGLVVDPTDVVDAGHRIAEMLMDVGRMSELGRRAEARSSMFSWEAAADAIMVTLTNLSSKR